jgi:hypothetical protein
LTLREAFMANDERALGLAMAGAAIAAATLEALFDKGVLNLAEVRSVLDKSMSALGTHSGAPGVNQARTVIASMQSGRFSERA